MLGEYYFEINELKKVYNSKEDCDISCFLSNIKYNSIFSSFENDYFYAISCDGTKSAKIIYTEDNNGEIN